MSERTMREKVETVRGHRFIRLKSNRMVSFWDTVRKIESTETALARWFSRAFKLAEHDDYELESLSQRIDQLEEYLGALRSYMEEQHGKAASTKRIALLRNVKGRTPEEAEAFLRKADQLEREGRR